MTDVPPPRRQASHLLARSVSAARRQRAGLLHTAHRPWPLPDRRWIMGQSWLQLLFMHWPVPPDALRPAVPPELPIDTFDGSAWIAITPFEVLGVRLRATPPVPWLSHFPELNVRTYTTVDGRAGIWFLSLDAGSAPAVAAARRLYRLPYFRAEMEIGRRGACVTYRSWSASIHRPRAAVHVEYAPTGPPYSARPGTLEHFLVERYCLYALDDARRVHSAEIHHPPWQLQPAEATIHENTMTAPFGIELPPAQPLLHYADRQDVVVWPLAPVRSR
jgi:uncharacterized protein YqjF (DUF2071 family)